MLHLRRGLCSILVLLMVFQCSSGVLCLAEGSEGFPGIEVEPAGEPLSSIECFAYLDEQDQYLFPSLQPGVILAMSDSYGRPAYVDMLPAPLASGEESSLYQETVDAPSAALLANRSAGQRIAASALAFSGLSFPVIRPSLNPNLPALSTPTPKPNPLSITSPKKGETVAGNSTFKIAWKLNSGRKPTYDLFLSTNDGETYDYIIQDVKDLFYKWKVPNADYTACRIKVEAWVGDVLLAEAESDRFIIKKEKTPPKKTTPFPEQVSTPAPDEGLLPFDAINPDAVYRTAGQFFINPQLGAQRWLRCKLQADGAKTILWQVSKYPFTTDNDQALSPAGLLVSGALDPGQNEFVIDFGAIVDRLTGKQDAGEGLGASFQVNKRQVLLPQYQYTFHIRALALDAAGRLLGDAGQGLSIGYGKPLMDTLYDAGIIIQTWALDKAYLGGPIYQKFIHQTKGFYAHPDDPMWILEFRERPPYATAQEFQLSTIPFENNADSYMNPAGLVFRDHADYQKISDKPWAMRQTLIFDEFVPSVEALGTSTIIYYARMLFFVQDQLDPGRQYVVPSETQVIFYNNLELSRSDIKYAPTVNITVESGVPFTRVVSYSPIQWEDPNAKEYYEVSRRIMAQENMLYGFDDNGHYTVVPFGLRSFYGDFSSIEDYQQRVDTYLSVGTEVRFKNAEPGFFDDLGEILSYAYNSVKEGYDEIKNAVVDVVADNFPFLNDKQREALRDAVAAALDIGLTALGIPPSLPDFEEALAEGFDYCLKVALQEVCVQLGIPEDAIPDDVRRAVSEEVARQVASRTPSGGGIKLSYLRPSTTRCYRPACVVVQVLNHSDKPTVGGTLTAGYSVKNHFYRILKPAQLPIPSLQPGEELWITCYLAPNIDIPVVQYKPGFEYYYYGKEDATCVFRVSAIYDVKDAETLAREQGLHREAPVFSFENYCYVYDHDPLYRFSLEQLACLPNDGDTSANYNEFYGK